MVGEVLGAKVRCTKPKRVVEPGNLLRRKCETDGDTEARDADLGNRSNIRHALLVIFVRQTVTTTDAVKLCLRSLLYIRATRDVGSKPLLDRRRLSFSIDRFA